MIRVRRGVSEIFSALLIVMITLAAGLTIYMAIVSYLGNQESITANELQRAQARATESLVVVRAYIEASTGHLWITVATSSGGATVYSVYVDESPATPIGFSLPISIGPNRLVTIGPFLSPTTSQGSHTVKVITDYGSATGYAEVIG